VCVMTDDENNKFMICTFHTWWRSRELNHDAMSFRDALFKTKFH